MPAVAERGAPAVLIVDDDAFVRRPLELFLRDEGFAPLTAGNGDECLERVRRHRPALIIMDVMMPGRDGFTVCAALKGDPASRAIPVILLTGRGDEADQKRSREVGADCLIMKPYSPSELVRTVRGLVGAPQLRAEGA
jgi:two-component system alkaline phosphatase synthesis response regulator PhoP